MPGLLKYKEKRHNLMNKLSDVQFQIEEEPLSQKVIENLQNYNNIIDDITPEKLTLVLCEFYQSRSIQLVQTSRILLSRWARVCK